MGMDISLDIERRRQVEFRFGMRSRWYGDGELRRRFL